MKKIPGLVLGIFLAGRLFAQGEELRFGDAHWETYDLKYSGLARQYYVDEDNLYDMEDFFLACKNKLGQRILENQPFARIDRKDGKVHYNLVGSKFLSSMTPTAIEDIDAINYGSPVPLKILPKCNTKI